MKNLGDITKISGRDAPTVNVIIGGSPCQDLSVAGKRAGLQGERSGLFMEQIRIIKEMREKENSHTDKIVLPIDGKDIIKTFKLKPSPLIGQCLEWVKDLYFENPNVTKEQCLEYIKIKLSI